MTPTPNAIVESIANSDPFPEETKGKTHESLQDERIAWLRKRLSRIEIYLLVLLFFQVNEWLHIAY